MAWNGLAPAYLFLLTILLALSAPVTLNFFLILTLVLLLPHPRTFAMLFTFLLS